MSDDLTTSEGVDEGSAASTTEGSDQTNEGSGVSGALGAASRDGEPAGEYDPAPPVETGLPGGTRADQPLAPGQQLQEGEG